MKTLWVDLLCWNSVLHILALRSRTPIERIYFLNAVQGNVWSKALSQILKVPVVQCTWLVQSQEKIGGMSVFEWTQLRLLEVLDRFERHPAVQPVYEELSRRNGFNAFKFKEHLREEAYPRLIKPGELIATAQHFCRGDHSRNIFLIRKTPVTALLKDIWPGFEWRLYSTFLTQRLPIPAREDYFSDREFNRKYYADRFTQCSAVEFHWLTTTINAVLVALGGWKKPESGARIGVELIQSRMRLDQINDLYWFPESAIAPVDVCGIQYEDFDEESARILKDLKIRRYKVVRNPLKLAKALLNKNRLSVTPLGASVGLCLSFLPKVLWLTVLASFWNVGNWIRVQSVHYGFRTAWWQDIYQKLSVKILWTMFDVEPEKFIKAQAVERLDGIYAGSHWSNFQMCCRGDDQKAYDAFFPWGPHFPENIYKRYPFKKVFPAGYPLDFYFKLHAGPAGQLRDSYKGKFIVSYQDNIVGNDLPYSRRMQRDIYQMLMRTLDEYPQLTVFLKPKRLLSLAQMQQDLPEIEKYIAADRMVVFLGETKRTKAVAAQIGMASDVVIGLGVSSVAAECFFAGTLSVHADFTGFDSNPFAVQGLNKVVFRSCTELEDFLHRCINGKQTLVKSDYDEYYWRLDPFQDGKAYRRTGRLLTAMYEVYKAGGNQAKALQKADVLFNTEIKVEGRSL